MTNKTDKAIRSFKRISNELNSIECNNYTDGNHFSQYDLTTLKASVGYIIDDLEEEYQSNHSFGAYKGD
jgi:hypothetical protein